MSVYTSAEAAPDLAPLFANCHAMAHRRRATVTSIDDSKAMTEEYGKQLTERDACRRCQYA